MRCQRIALFYRWRWHYLIMGHQDVQINSFQNKKGKKAYNDGCAVHTCFSGVPVSKERRFPFSSASIIPTDEQFEEAIPICFLFFYIFFCFLPLTALFFFSFFFFPFFFSSKYLTLFSTVCPLHTR